MGYIPDAGLFVQMTSDEPDPLRTMTRHMDMVCRDSALEAFFAFPDVPLSPEDDYTPDDNGMYFNFEVNANGAMYAKTGRGRKGREMLSPEEMDAAGVRAWLLPGGWGAEFLVPVTLTERLVGITDFRPQDVFFCNFYKRSEDPKIEHYLSFSPIDTETPNFHLPRFFAKAVVRTPNSL
jgi:hypothetical protein